MIYKDLDPFDKGTKFEVAGRKAEEQMAFYLRRFFGNSADVDVVNYLRIELAGEVAQMDHLVILPDRLLIVESKSVTGKVQIKDDGQWIRWYDNQSQGMRSPITQAKMQAMILKDLLNQTVKQKGAFDRVPVEVLVAISDSGVILWPSTGALPEVCKSDQVPDRINARLAEHRAQPIQAGLLNAQNRKKIAGFLCQMHKPLHHASVAVEAQKKEIPQKMPPPAPAPVQEKKTLLPEKVCKHCHSTNVEIRFGRSYYFHCLKCQQSTSIKFNCPACGGEGRLRKDGKQFFAECRGCAVSAPFFTNGTAG